MIPIHLHKKSNIAVLLLLSFFFQVVAIAQSSQDSLLIIMSNKLYKTGILDTTISTYRQDILSDGWHSEFITVSSTLDTTATYITQSDVILKAVISIYYNQGYDGFVFIGSPHDIPTAYWSYTAGAAGHTPCDLYYADMDPWLLKVDSVYASYDTSGNFYGANFAPEMFFSRICAGPITSNITEEATLVAKYFERVHDFRVNGINLTPAQNQRALLFKVGKDYANKGNWGVDNIARDMYFELDYGLTSCYNYIDELEKGYRFVDLFSHSSAASNGFGFNTAILKNTDARINFINLFCCSACNFTVDNFGATYLFETDYALNVTGSVGAWGMVHDSLFYQNLDTGMAVGPALQNYIQRTIPPQEGWPKGVLLGDPLLKYTANHINKAPRVLNSFHNQTVEYGDTFELVINAMDPENDVFVLSMPGLAPNAVFNGNLFKWLPDTQYIGITEEFIIQAYDVAGNSFHETFTVKVPSLDSTEFMNGDFEMGKNEKLAYWEPSLSMQNPVWELPGTGYDTMRCISINHDKGPSDSYWFQTIKLIPNQKYILQGWIQGENITNLTGGQTGANLCVAGTWTHTTTSLLSTFVWTQVMVEFTAPADSLVSIACRLGYWGNVVTGKAWFDNITVSIVVGDEYENLAFLDLNIYPNPVNQMLSIDYYQETITELELRDIFGRLILHKEIHGMGPQHHCIDVIPYPAGFYLITLRDKKKSVTKKIVIRH